MKHSAEYYIEHLEMEPHVEGGYFKECLLEKEERNLWSSIYFMLVSFSSFEVGRGVVLP